MLIVLPCFDASEVQLNTLDRVAEALPQETRLVGWSKLVFFFFSSSVQRCLTEEGKHTLSQLVAPGLNACTCQTGILQLVGPASLFE